MSRARLVPDPSSSLPTNATNVICHKSGQSVVWETCKSQTAQGEGEKAHQRFRLPIDLRLCIKQLQTQPSSQHSLDIFLARLFLWLSYYFELLSPMYLRLPVRYNSATAFKLQMGLRWPLAVTSLRCFSLGLGPIISAGSFSWPQFLCPFV
jgi:hypothetical protein